MIILSPTEVKQNFKNLNPETILSLDLNILKETCVSYFLYYLHNHQYFDCEDSGDETLQILREINVALDDVLLFNKLFTYDLDMLYVDINDNYFGENLHTLIRLLRARTSNDVNLLKAPMLLNSLAIDDSEEIKNTFVSTDEGLRIEVHGSVTFKFNGKTYKATCNTNQASSIRNISECIDIWALV